MGARVEGGGVVTLPIAHIQPAFFMRASQTPLQYNQTSLAACAEGGEYGGGCREA
jgi:hypothetical protein